MGCSLPPVVGGRLDVGQAMVGSGVALRLQQVADFSLPFHTQGEGEGWEGGLLVLALALAVAFALRLLTSPAVERAEHRSGTRGEEAHVFERSELCAAPLFREERREPAGVARRIAARLCFLLVTFLCTSKEK